MKLSDMRALLDKRNIQLTRSLGQNFLHDANQLKRIADAGEVTKADKVLEIGPGLGPLTELLLERAGEVLAIEMDQRLVEVLRERFSATLALPMNLPRSADGPRPQRVVGERGVECSVALPTGGALRAGPLALRRMNLRRSSGVQCAKF